MRRYANFASRWIGIACLIIIGVVWAVTVQRIQFEREDDIAQAVRVNDNLALALEEQTTRTIKLVEQAVQVLRYEYQSEGAKMPPDLYRALVALDPEVYSFLGVIDEHGEVVHGAPGQRVNLADREYFAYHRDHAGDGLRVSAPIVGKVSGVANIPLSRRIDRPDGGFGGVVAAGIYPAYFSRFYAKVDVGAEGMVELVGLDGVNYARHSKQGMSRGQDMRGTTLLKRAATDNTGHYLSQGRIDGIPRYVSFRVLRDHGLVVAVGTSVSHVLAEANERTRWYLLGSILATLLVLSFGTGMIVAMQRQKRATQAALAGEKLYRVTYDQAAVGIAHVGIDGTYRRANAKYCEIVGYTEPELLALTFMEVVHPDDVPSPEAMQRVLTEGRLVEEERFVRKDGSLRSCLVSVSVVRDAADRPDYFVAMVQDVTERKRAEAQLAHNAQYDTLTGLPNRSLLFDRIAQMLKVARRKERTVGVLFADLDRFKSVNDTLGHENGDLLLRKAAARLSGVVRTEDTVARIGGDEFVVLLPELADSQDAARVAKKIIEAMAAPFLIAGREVFVTASVGIAVFPGDGPEGEVLVNNANAAMQRAKQIGRNNFQFYTASLNTRSAEKLLLEADLRRALERREFLLHFQPRANLRDGSLEGFEALIRWRKADGSLVAPGAFIPLLEESGLIVGVGEWVVRAACAQLREWRRAGFAPVPVAINIAAKQFLRTNLCELIDSATREFNIDPTLLEVEITESDAMVDPDWTQKVLAGLKERGIKIAIDDFGTGYSSLGYLKKFPIDFLKLDRSFVTGLPADKDDVSIARAVIAMAHSLGFEVVAEGVETEAQRRFLATHACDQMQGYLYAKPLPAAECAAFLKMADPVAEKAAA